MKNLSEQQIRHLIEIHQEAINTLELQIADRPKEPTAGFGAFPPIVGFVRTMAGLTNDDPAVETPFVAIRYANGCWFINRGAGATSQGLSWDGLLDWIHADHWPTISVMTPSMPLADKEILDDLLDEDEDEENPFT